MVRRYAPCTAEIERVDLGVTVLLALFGGVAGSALLELWWKPWRTRRRVAALLVEEVNLNAQMIQNYIHVLRRDPGRISPAFELSHLAFDAVAQEVGELPPTVAGHVILAYLHFEYLPRLLEILRERNRRWREAEGATAEVTWRSSRTTRSTRSMSSP